MFTLRVLEGTVKEASQTTSLHRVRAPPRRSSQVGLVQRRREHKTVSRKRNIITENNFRIYRLFIKYTERWKNLNET